MQERVTDVDDPRLADYTGLTDVKLRISLEAESGLFIAEGTKVISRAVAAGYPVRSVLLAERRLGDLPALSATTAPVYVVPDEIAERLTGYRIHRGALASLHRKPLPEAAALAATSRRVIVLEDLVDHGNVGAIFRCAAALGVDAVFLSPRCADPLYRRSVKVSMGAVFAIPYARMTGWYDGLAELRATGFRLLALTPDQDATPIGEAGRPSGSRCCSAPRVTACPPAGGTRRIRPSASRCIPARWRPGLTRSTWSPPPRSRAMSSAVNPKLRPVRQAISVLTWCFAGSAGWRSGYVKVSGIGAPIKVKACRWMLVGSVSIAMVTWVPVYRTWLRVKVARCSSRPRKLR